ncbi:MAG TPA: M23 family metallopeptidase, partial [Planctomycetota bacterium]|nr:M23 family metallopeptidase [Planctomycetota bacterium]
MSAPNLELQIQPVENGKATCLLLAPRTAAGQTGIKLVLRLRLANKGSTELKVKGITFSFPGSSAPSKEMEGINLDGALDLVAGDAAYWSNGRVDLDLDPDVKDFVNNAVFLTGSAPPQVKVEVTCKGHSSPATIAMPLALHVSPVAGGSYRFPYAAGELRSGEYYEASAVHWANGGAKGTQIFAHDIGVVGWDGAAKAWSGLLPGGSKLKNEDWRIWGKPIRAVADGFVESWSDGLADNTITQDSDGHLLFPDPTPKPGSGNSITIRHGTDRVIYCHFRHGSMDKSLQVKDKRVFEGQVLGRVGNTGRATNPHTHLECTRDSDDALRPMPFRNAWVLDRSKLKPPSAKGSWFPLAGHGISKDSVVIWPASTSPGFPVPAVGISMAGDWANSYWVSPDLTSFEKTAQDLFDGKGRRLTCVATFLENGARRWAGIARAGDWANRFWVSDSLTDFQKSAQKLFDDKALRLVHASTFVEGGKRKWAGIARSGDWASRLVIKNDLASFSAECQSLFDDHGL